MTRLELERGDLDFDSLLEEVAGGRTLKECCSDDGGLCLSTLVVTRWIESDEKRLAAFRQAERVYADNLFGEIIPKVDAVMDKDDVPMVNMQTDRRFKVAAKLNPDKYGERMKVEHQAGRVGVDAALLVGMGELLSRLSAQRERVVNEVPMELPRVLEEI